MVRVKPSNAAEWCACPAWPTMAAKYPYSDKSRQQALDGRAIHALGAHALMNWAETEPLSAHIGRPYEGGSYTQEMVDLAEFYAGEVKKRASLYSVEHLVDCAYILPGMRGYVDATWVDGESLVVVELKTGVVPVHPESNRQMLCYVPGLVRESRTTITSIEFIVIQPLRYDGRPAVSSWVTSIDHATHLIKEINHKAVNAASGAPLCVPAAPFPCRSCPGKHDCAALQESAVTWTQPLRYLNQTPALIGAELANLTEALEVIKTRISGLEEIGLAKNHIPGYSKAPGPPKVRWRYPDDVIISIGDLHGLKLGSKKAPTPKQAIQKGLPSSVVEALSEEVPGEIKLKAHNIALAKRIFEK